MTPHGLERLHEVMAGHVERGYVPGLVAAVSHRGEVHVDAIGTMAVGGDQPMQRDTIFRISSMTKPITAVATMILVEECKLRLDEPVDRLLPELANRQVLRRLDGPIDDTVPAHRPITVRDLLTFRMGLGMVVNPPDPCPILDAAGELGIVGLGPPDRSAPTAPDEWLQRLGTLPLMHQPGETWQYNTGSYVLGVLIARAAGQPFESFLRERIFDPLGMVDTGFTVPADRLHRLAASYTADFQTGELTLVADVGDAAWVKPPAFPDGGAGLASTVDDYLAFAHLLLDGGRSDRERILSRWSVEAMTTDQLTAGQKATSGFLPNYWDDRGWGFGVSVVTGRDGIASNPGRYGWDGGSGTSWQSDPAEGLAAVLLTQREAFPLFSDVYQDFWTSVYLALDAEPPRAP